MTPLTSHRDPRFVLSKENRMLTTTRPTRLEDQRDSESGFALILAILALLLLTFLGLTIATSTSTELQIATNYRWGQQALYNAEAGLEAAKVIISNQPVADAIKGITALPAVRPIVPAVPWPLGAVSLPVEPMVGRDFENGVNPATANCDRRGGGMGYGLVLTDKLPTPTRFENISNWGGQNLNGTFTIWIRRELTSRTDGQFNDYDGPDSDVTAVVTVEGTAPYTGAPPSGFEQANRSVRILETTLVLNQSQGITSCSGLEGQAGMSPQGDNFGCAMLDDTSVGALQP
jgi:hypothetical protein